MNEMKSWSWVIPGIVAGLLLGAAAWMVGQWSEAGMYCAGSLVFAAVVLMLQAVGGYRAFFRQVEVDQLSQRRSALADTAENRLADALRGMHPETVRLLFKHRLEVWRIKEMPSQELLLPVLDADPRITLPFMEYVLRNSNPFSIMPKRMLNDKAHSFDPRGVVRDYEQYDALHRLLEGRMWLTAGFGNQPGQWIEPWNPDLVARRFGVSLEEEAEAEVVGGE